MDDDQSGLSEISFTSTITEVAGQVWLSLPEDMYLKLTPEQARTVGWCLFKQAAKAEGKTEPTIIVSPTS